MSKIIDISVGIHPDMPTWPDSKRFSLEPIMRLDNGDEANVSQLDMEIHIGTHVDAPWHFVSGAKTIDKVPLDILMGEAMVVEMPDVSSITADNLEALNLPSGVERLLFHTRNSQLWENGAAEFYPDFVALAPDAARWVVERQIKLVGVDYLSVQRYGDPPDTHQILLGAEVIVIEGLNLSGVKSGRYNLSCLPLKLIGAEGSPARAVLVPIE
ncbi:MAG: cyclase family protein [Cyanobacteria bacterium J06631_2]